MDVAIVDRIRTDMVQQASMMTTHGMMMVIQEKTRSYIKQAPDDDFIPLAIEMYGYFHFCFYSFFTTCA